MEAGTEEGLLGQEVQGAARCGGGGEWVCGCVGLYLWAGVWV